MFVDRANYGPPRGRARMPAPVARAIVEHMNRSAPYRLVLLRHGESEWNQAGLFTGWVDVGLSERGVAEAVYGGELLRSAGLVPDVVHTSLLTPLAIVDPHFGVSGTYLDEEAATASIAGVRQQGQTVPVHG